MRAAQVDAVRERELPYSDVLRKRVQFQLHEGPTLRLDLVLSESILRRPVGGALAPACSSFSVLSFREDRSDDVVYVENLHGGTWLEDECEREPYTQPFKRLTKSALSAEEPIELIANAEHALQKRMPVI